MTKEQFNEELNALIKKAPKENLFFLCHIDDNGVSTMNIKCSEMFMATMINGIFMRYPKVKEFGWLCEKEYRA